MGGIRDEVSVAPQETAADDVPATDAPKVAPSEEAWVPLFAPPSDSLSLSRLGFRGRGVG